MPLPATATATDTVSTSASKSPEPAHHILADGRIIVNATAEYITGFFRQHTAIQAQLLLAPYIDKWMKVSGVVGEVSEHSSLISLSFSYDKHPDSMPLMYFQYEWKDRLIILRRGDHVTVLGQITALSDQWYVKLSNCELL